MEVYFKETFKNFKRLEAHAYEFKNDRLLDVLLWFKISLN